MGQSAQAGSILRIEITGTSAFGQTAKDIQSLVTQTVAGGLFSITDFVLNSPSVLGGILPGNWFTFQYDAQIKIQLQVDTTDVDYVRDNLASAFYEATGNQPTARSVVSVTSPGGTETATGEGTPSNPQAKDIWTQITDAISKFFSGLSTVLWIILGLIVLGIVLIAFGPNIPKIARSVA